MPVLPWLPGASFAELLAGTARLPLTPAGTVLPVPGVTAGAVLIGAAGVPRVPPRASPTPAAVFPACAAALLAAIRR